MSVHLCKTGLANRSSQPLAVPMTKFMVDNLLLKERKLGAASGGLSPSR